MPQQNAVQKLTNTKMGLIFAFAHLPEELVFLSYPPQDITKNKYDDKKYLKKCQEIIEETKNNKFGERKDKITPYSKERLLKIFAGRLEVL